MTSQPISAVSVPSVSDRGSSMNEKLASQLPLPNQCPKRRWPGAPWVSASPSIATSSTRPPKAASEDNRAVSGSAASPLARPSRTRAPLTITANKGSAGTNQTHAGNCSSRIIMRHHRE